MKLSKIALACLVATSTMATQFASADDSFEFHGYARAAITYEADGKQSIGPSTVTGAPGNALGRLGNESNGGEFLLLKKFEGENKTNFEVGYMMEDWDGSFTNLSTKQIWAGGSNIFASQPNAYVWAGKVFHSRLQADLNDLFILMNDGTGAGVKGLDLGFSNLELGAVTFGGGKYALTSKMSDISMGPVSLDVIVNYGFSDNTNASGTNEGADALNLVTHFKGWGHNFIYRYADNVDNNMAWKNEGASSHLLHFDGAYSFTEKAAIGYLAEYYSADDSDDSKDRNAVSLIARPTYQWNDIHSTWLEFGYAAADYDSGDESSGWKATYSQNIAVGGATWSRPMLRFYVTSGAEDPVATDSETYVIAGAMFEAWW